MVGSSPAPRAQLPEESQDAVEQLVSRMIRYARRLKGESEETRRAAANHLYYSVISTARVVFSAPLHEGYNSHQHFAAHRLRKAMKHDGFSIEVLERLEAWRRDLYRTRIHADYNLAEPFDGITTDELAMMTGRLHNALVKLSDD